MPDRPPLPGSSFRFEPEPGPTHAGGDGRVRDAVFEDVELYSSASRSVFETVPADEIESAEPMLAVTRPPIDLPVADTAHESPQATPPSYVPPATEPGYDPGHGFRIEFDGPTAPDDATSTALIPLTPAALAPAGPPALPPGPPPMPRAEARRSARDKAQMLRRHKGLILACTLLGFGLAALYSFLAPPTFEAYSVLLVTPPPAQGTQANVSGGFVDAPGTESRKTLNQALIVQQAPAIAESTAQALLGLDAAGTLSTVTRAAERFGAPVTTETLAEYLQSQVVTVKPAGEEVDAIRVAAVTNDPREAALIARMFTERYQALTRETNLARARDTRDLLDEQIVRRQGELDEIESQLQRFMTSENAAGLDEQTRMSVSQIGALQGQLDLARVTVQTQQARLTQLEADLASVRGRLTQSATAAATTSPAETAAVDGEIASLETLIEQVYLRNPDLRTNPYAHPDLRSMLTRLDGLRAERRRIAGRQVDAAVASGGLDVSSPGANGAQYISALQQQISAVRADLSGARAQASTLRQRLAEEESALRQVPQQQMGVDQLQRQRTAVETTLIGLQRERDAADLAASTELGVTQLIRDVQVPRKPSGPNVPLNLALGTVLGLLVGLAGAAVRYRTDARVHTPHDLADQGFAVVGTIPDVSAALREGRHEVGASSIHPALVTLTHPFSPQAEAFRHLHANLSGAEGQAPPVVLVSGPEIGTGKSLVAGNMAVAAAQAGRRVLLVDADLRKPTVADLLGLGDTPPLGEGPEGSNLVYWSTAVPSLFAMTPRASAESPDQMWAPHVVGDLLANLRGAFDLIVIDAPSALVAADAALLAPHADAALLVAQAGHSDLDAMAQVATEFAGVGLTRIGAVLNRFDPRRSVGFKQTETVRQTAYRS